MKIEDTFSQVRPRPKEMNEAFHDAWFEYFWMAPTIMTDNECGEDYIMGGEL